MSEPRFYGQWSGRPRGIPEDPNLCIEAVREKDGFKMVSYQCCRKRGHGPDGLYCKQHAKKHEENPQ